MFQRGCGFLADFPMVDFNGCSFGICLGRGFPTDLPVVGCRHGKMLKVLLFLRNPRRKNHGATIRESSVDSVCLGCGKCS